MKMSILKYMIPPVAVLSMLLQGCLKDKFYDQGITQTTRNNGSPAVIDMPLSATSTANFVQYSFNSSNKDTTIDFIPITYNSAKPAPQDIHVTLQLSDSLVTAYNNANGTSYEVPDPSTYSIVGGL